MNNYPEIEELLNNSNLRFKLTENNPEILTENNIEHEKIFNFMSLDFFIPSLKERKQIIKFYGFPTDEDCMCLASYYTTLEDDNFFEIHVGFDVNEANKILLSKGYEKIGNTFNKGVICIEINSFSQNDKIEDFTISLKQKYLSNRLY